MWLLEGDLSRLTSVSDYKLHVSMGATKGFSLCRGGQEGGLQSVQGPQVFTDQAESVIPGHEVAYAVLTLPCPCRMGKNVDLLGSGRCGSRPSTGHLCDAWVCLVQAFRHHMASWRPISIAEWAKKVDWSQGGTAARPAGKVPKVPVTALEAYAQYLRSQAQKDILSHAPDGEEHRTSVALLKVAVSPNILSYNLLTSEQPV